MHKLLFLLFLFFWGNVGVAQTSTPDSTHIKRLSKISSTESDSVKVAEYLEIARLHLYSNSDTLYKYSRLAYNLLPGNKYPALTAKVHLFMSGAYFLSGQYEKCLYYAQTGLRVLDSPADSSMFHLQADLLSAEGTAFGSLGNYQLSLEKYFDALQIYESIGDTLNAQVSRGNIGVIYMRLSWYDKALEIFQKLDQTMTDGTPAKTSIPVNLGLVYYELGDYERSKEYLYQALALKGQVDIRAYGLAQYKLGQILTIEGEYEEAILSFNTSIEIFEALNNEIQTVQSLTGLAEVYARLNNLSTALNYAQQAYSIADRYNALPQKFEALNCLYNITKLRGDYPSALSYHEEYKIISDSLLSAQVNQISSQLEAEYEYKKREQELLLAQKQQQIFTEAMIKDQRALLSVFFIIITFGAFSFFSIYRNYRQKKESNYLLSIKNQEIQIQADQLRQLNKIKNRIFSMIAHDLRGPLSSLHSVITLIEMNRTSAEELNKLIPMVSRRFKYTSTLLNNLLQWSQSQMEGYKVIYEVFDITQVLQEKKVLLQSKTEEKNLHVILPDTSHFVYADRIMIDLVIQNLLTNAIKFCYPENSITVTVTEHNGKSTICVQDTGIGIAPDKLETLFSDNFYTTRGTMDEKGTGLGLMLCKEFVEKNGGTVWVKSTPGTGTEVYFTLTQAEASTKDDEVSPAQ